MFVRAVSVSHVCVRAAVSEQSHVAVLSGCLSEVTGSWERPLSSRSPSLIATALKPSGSLGTLRLSCGQQQGHVLKAS